MQSSIRLRTHRFGRALRLVDNSNMNIVSPICASSMSSTQTYWEWESRQDEAICVDVIEDSMCIMHDDGSVTIIEILGGGVTRSEVISSANILKVLHHYRPFKGVLKNNLQ